MRCDMCHKKINASYIVKVDMETLFLCSDCLRDLIEQFQQSHKYKIIRVRPMKMKKEDLYVSE